MWWYKEGRPHLTGLSSVKHIRPKQRNGAQNGSQPGSRAAAFIHSWRPVCNIHLGRSVSRWLRDHKGLV